MLSLINYDYKDHRPLSWTIKKKKNTLTCQFREIKQKLLRNDVIKRRLSCKIENMTAYRDRYDVKAILEVRQRKLKGNC